MHTEDAEGEYEIKELREAEFTISKGAQFSTSIRWRSIGKTRITSLDVTSLPQNLSAVDKMVEIATIVELDKEQMVMKKYMHIWHFSGSSCRSTDRIFALKWYRQPVGA